MIDPNEKTKFVLINFNASNGQNEREFFDTIEQVTKYLNDEKILPIEDIVVYEISKEIKFKLVPT
jgi:hypothetical protein